MKSFNNLIRRSGNQQNITSYEDNAEGWLNAETSCSKEQIELRLCLTHHQAVEQSVANCVTSHYIPLIIAMQVQTAASCAGVLIIIIVAGCHFILVGMLPAEGKSSSPNSLHCVVTEEKWRNFEYSGEHSSTTSLAGN